MKNLTTNQEDSSKGASKNEKNSPNSLESNGSSNQIFDLPMISVKLKKVY